MGDGDGGWDGDGDTRLDVVGRLLVGHAHYSVLCDQVTGPGSRKFPGRWKGLDTTGPGRAVLGTRRRPASRRIKQPTTSRLADCDHCAATNFPSRSLGSALEAVRLIKFRLVSIYFFLYDIIYFINQILFI